MHQKKYIHFDTSFQLILKQNVKKVWERPTTPLNAFVDFYDDRTFVD